MASEHNDGPTREHTTTVVERGGSGAGLLIALAVIVFLAIGAWFLYNASRNDALESAAVSDAASSVARSVDSAADSVAGAADSVTVPAPAPAPMPEPAPAE